MMFEKCIDVASGPDTLLVALKDLKQDIASGSVRPPDMASVEAAIRSIEQELSRDIPNLGQVKMRACDLAVQLNHGGLHAAGRRISDAFPPYPKERLRGGCQQA
jgi:hypothetical protein